MEIGISSWSLPWAVGVPGHPPEYPLDAVALVNRAIAADVRVIQFADNLPLDRLEPGILDRVHHLTAEHGIAVEIGTRGIGPQLTDCLGLAVRFGAGFVRVVVDRGEDRPDPDAVVRRLAGFERSFRSAGVALAIENHDRFRCPQWLELIDRLGDWTGICLDTVNSYAALDPPDRVLEALAPLAINLHVKDFRIERALSGLGFAVVGTPVGAGMLDVGAVVEQVAGHGRAGSAIIELWTPPQNDLAATIALESRWLDRSVDYLRALPMPR